MPSACATSNIASAYAPMRSSGCACVASLMAFRFAHSSRPSVRSARDLVDVVLDQVLLRRPVQVALDHDLGGTDGQRGDLTTQVGNRLLLGCVDVGGGAFAHGGELRLEPLLLVSTEGVSLLARFLDDA